MKAMIFKSTAQLRDNPRPLTRSEWPDPEPASGELLLRVSACGVCHTEIDEIEGRTPPSVYPMIPGHQAVGRVAALGPGCTRFREGDRVGVGWIHSACGVCAFCRTGRENLCARFQATGRDVPGGYAEFLTVPEAFAYPIPAVFTDLEAAPLLCAGAIGYRSLRLAELRNGEALGLTGFGASGHLVLGMARRRFPDSPVYVFARSDKERTFARELGAAWAGDTGDDPPEKLHAVIDTTPAWKPVVRALERLLPGGRLVVNAIRKEDGDREWLLRLDYARHLWLEKEIKSVANVTRRDIAEFLALAAEIPLKPHCLSYPLADANQALRELKEGRIRGAKVLAVS